MALRAARSRREGAALDDPVKSEDGNFLNEPCSQRVGCRAARKREEAKVQECIGFLDGEQREVLVLRDIQGFSYEEIGVMLKLPQGTVRSRLFRARNALKDRLLRVFGDLK
jgi:RNA polymerase sigma-70 factor (ECF subfamily)